MSGRGKRSKPSVKPSSARNSNVQTTGLRPRRALPVSAERATRVSFRRRSLRLDTCLSVFVRGRRRGAHVTQANSERRYVGLDLSDDETGVAVTVSARCGAGLHSVALAALQGRELLQPRCKCISPLLGAGVATPPGMEHDGAISSILGAARDGLSGGIKTRTPGRRSLSTAGLQRRDPGQEMLRGRKLGAGVGV
jgi:hypothetical protein